MTETASEQITRNQHYIPQFYLKKFCGDKNQVEILSLEHDSLFTPRSPKSICFEEFFYGEKTGEGDKISQEVESFFGDLEAYLARRLPGVEEKLLNGKYVDEEEKWMISFLMSMLWIRGPVMREQNRKMIEDIAKQMMRLTFSRSESDIKSFFDGFDKSRGKVTSPEMRAEIKEGFLDKDYKLNVNNTFHMAMFEDIHKYANLFAAKDWFVYISKSKLGFITSDNPVAEVFPERTGFYGPSFFERDHYFALSPEILIYCKSPNKKNSKGIRRKTLYDCGHQKILSLNFSVARCAMKFVYARKKDNLEEILNIVKFSKKQQVKSLLKS